MVLWQFPGMVAWLDGVLFGNRAGCLDVEAKLCGDFFRQIER